MECSRRRELSQSSVRLRVRNVSAVEVVSHVPEGVDTESPPEVDEDRRPRVGRQLLQVCLREEDEDVEQKEGAEYSIKLFLS